MKILFCNIAWMKFYRGTCDGDIPIHGGSYVEENSDANESTNFLPIIFENHDYLSSNEKFFLGSFETKCSKVGKQNQLHIEKIQGCESLTNEDFVDDVLVVWCATSLTNCSKIVGWYKNAIVYRNYQIIELENEENSTYEHSFNVVANINDCVLLPEAERNKNKWAAARAQKKGRNYGFGRANVWYATEESAKEYIENVVKTIKSYEEENCIKGSYSNI
ncbi:MAG: hypothetical protein ACERLG_01755 [Sedimentibacter sp.]